MDRSVAIVSSVAVVVGLITFIFFLFPFSMSDSKPKSSSPVRLPEANVGPSNRGAEPEQRKTVLSKSYGTNLSSDLSSLKLGSGSCEI